MYNAQDTIEQCIESILNQSYKDIEVVIVNDGSTDDSLEICERYEKQDERVIILNQANKGAFEARRSGVRCCSGDYVTFVDADDFVIEKAYIAAKGAMDSSVDLILFPVARYYDANNIKYEKSKHIPGLRTQDNLRKEIFKKLIWDFKNKCPGMEPQMGVNIFKREILLDQFNNTNIDFWYGEDIAIVYPIYKKIESLQIIDYCYYMHRQKEKDYWPYVRNKAYFDGVYALYKHLINEFSEQSADYDFIKQIEYFYMYAVNLKGVIYGEKINNNNYLFPFDKVESGATVVLHGAGKVGREYYSQLESLSYCKSVIWVDKKYELLNDERIISPDDAFELKFDYIVIAIGDKNICETVKDYYIQNGIDERKIIY